MKNLILKKNDPRVCARGTEEYFTVWIIENGSYYAQAENVTEEFGKAIIAGLKASEEILKAWQSCPRSHESHWSGAANAAAHAVRNTGEAS